MSELVDNYEKIIKDYKDLMEHASKIATQWVKYQNDGYSRAQAKEIADGVIKFIAYPITSGITLSGSLPIRFLTNQEGMEAAATNQLKRFKEIREKLYAEYHHIRELAKKETMLYNQLQTATLDNPTGNPYGSFMPTV